MCGDMHIHHFHQLGFPKTCLRQIFTVILILLAVIFLVTYAPPKQLIPVSQSCRNVGQQYNAISSSNSSSNTTIEEMAHLRLQRTVLLFNNIIGASTLADCQGLYQPPTYKDTWLNQHINNAAVFTFSAYIKPERDAVYNGLVLLGMGKRNVDIDVSCQLWCRTGVTVLVSGATVEYLPYYHGELYYSIMIHCEFPKSCSPGSVSIVSGTCDQPQNSISISKNSPCITHNASHQFTACVSPLNRNYNRAYELIEMIEVNRILGVTNFVIYNHSTGPDVDKALHYYAKQGIVSIISWVLPVKVNGIHYFGQTVSQNDCLYRNRGRSKYLVYTDLDEFIVPRIHQNLNSLISYLSHDNAGAFVFRNVFFHKDWPSSNISNDYMKQARKYKLMTLLKTTREDIILPINERSKCIVDPLLVENVGIHNVDHFKKPFRRYDVPTDLGLLYHYRDVQAGYRPSGWWNRGYDSQRRRIEDHRMHAYSDKIIKHVTDVWDHLHDVCSMNSRNEINCDNL